MEELWVKQGLSAGQCAQWFPSRTRNSIIGRVNRLGLCRRRCRPRGPRMTTLKPPVSVNWPAERDEQLKVLIGKAESWVLIAAKIGMSTMACRARAKRLGLAKNKSVPSFWGGRRTKKGCVRSKQQDNYDCLNEPPPNRKTQGQVLLKDLERNQCRWPIGDPQNQDFTFCGDDVWDGSSYCPEHHSRAHKQTERKRI
ncbi:MAG: hypothetical protein GY952_06675 [Rhodobacteraceae bacterium]|nr:hypothetical protein [Paracoccaceae bacterium]